MELATTTAEWMPVVRTEYLQDFVQQGGAGVKFAVPETDTEAQALVDALRKEALGSGYLFVALDAARVKVHMIDQMFHAVAKEVDWDRLSLAFLRSTLSDLKYTIPDESEGCSLDKLAALNQAKDAKDPAEMRRDVSEALRKSLFNNYAMTQEFRIAMLRLCQAQLVPNEGASGTAAAVKEWLRGELRLISSLKSAFIFQRIGRHNARHMLFSLAHWLNLAGSVGLVLVLDITRFMEKRRPAEPDGTLHYSTAAVRDGYEVLRQFVDGTDELKHGLIVVVARPAALLSKDENPRGLKAYDPLWFRIADDVHDKIRVNPLASLVRLGGSNAARDAATAGG
ncbi:MAG: hypothetical protein HW397_295 [Dehalococcoidia bacterium]|nr:hypothetical protein [Dehalococcoidia bacterium]